MSFFTAKIHIIGVNPYVIPPAKVLKGLFNESGKSKGPIPVNGKLNGHSFHQTLVKFQGKWRLYLNTPMRKAAGIDVGDKANVEIYFDPKDRTVSMHPKLKEALDKNKNAKKVFDGLIPSRQKEIKRYINHLKTEKTLQRNIQRAINFLLKTERFIGRDEP